MLLYDCKLSQHTMINQLGGFVSYSILYAFTHNTLTHKCTHNSPGGASQMVKRFVVLWVTESTSLVSPPPLPSISLLLSMKLMLTLPLALISVTCCS